MHITKQTEMHALEMVFQQFPGFSVGVVSSVRAGTWLVGSLWHIHTHTLP